MLCEEASDGSEGFGRCFHNIVSGAAVDMDVEEGGDKRASGEVEVVAGGKFACGA